MTDVKPTHHGISLYSRYACARECEGMARMIDLMAVSDRFHIREIFCDSKATNSWKIETVGASEVCVKRIGILASFALTEAFGGFNDLMITDSNDVVLFHADSNWEHDAA